MVGQSAAALPTSREPTQRRRVARSQRGLLCVTPAFDLPLACQCAFSGSMAFGEHQCDRSPLRGVRPTSTSLVILEAKLRVSAGSDVERAVGAFEDVNEVLSHD